MINWTILDVKNTDSEERNWIVTIRAQNDIGVTTFNLMLFQGLLSEHKNLVRQFIRIKKINKILDENR